MGIVTGVRGEKLGELMITEVLMAFFSPMNCSVAVDKSGKDNDINKRMKEKLLE